MDSGIQVGPIQHRVLSVNEEKDVLPTRALVRALRGRNAVAVGVREATYQWEAAAFAVPKLEGADEGIGETQNAETE